MRVSRIKFSFIEYWSTISSAAPTLKSCCITRRVCDVPITAAYDMSPNITFHDELNPGLS
jgi:hypothetical protein